MIVAWTLVLTMLPVVMMNGLHGRVRADDEYVRRLYTTFMGREPAAEEITYWTGEIKKGTQTRYSIMQFFGQSPEFTDICKKYGIDRGSI